MEQLVGQLADPAFQLAAVPAFHDIAGAGRKGRERLEERTGREEEGRRGWKKMGNYWLNK